MNLYQNKQEGKNPIGTLSSKSYAQRRRRRRQRSFGGHTDTHRRSVSTTPKPNYGRQDIINEILHLACVNCRIHFSPPALRNLGYTQCITLLSTPFEWISSYPKLGSTHFSIHLYTSQKVIQHRDVQHCVGLFTSSVLMFIHNYRQLCCNTIFALSAELTLQKIA